MVGLHLGGEHITVGIVAKTEGKETRLGSEDTAPLTEGGLFGGGFIHIVACGSRGIAVGSVVMLILQSGKEVVLAEGDVDFVCENGGLGLGKIAVGIDVARERP